MPPSSLAEQKQRRCASCGRKLDPLRGEVWHEQSRKGGRYLCGRCVDRSRG